MSSSTRFGLAAALALGLAAAPEAQTVQPLDQDEAAAVQQLVPVAAASAEATVDIDDRDPGYVARREAPLQLVPADVSDQDADAPQALVRATASDALTALTPTLDVGRDGTAALAILPRREVAEGPLSVGRDGAGTPARLRVAFDGVLRDGRHDPEPKPDTPVLDDEVEVAEAPPAQVAETSTGLSLSLVRPNPARDRAELTFALDAATHATVRVFDVRGRQVAVAFDAPAPADAAQRVALDVGALAPGTYVAVLTAAGQTASQTFQVVR